MSKKLKAGDLFSGAGGFTLAAERAGLDVVWAVNHWGVALDTHELNHAGTAHMQHNLIDASAAWFGDLPDVDVLTASPACIGFSLARHTSTERSDHAQEMLRSTAFTVLTAVSGMARKKRLPRLVVVENVRQFLNWGFDPDSDDGSQYRWWVNGLEGFGYRSQELVFDAADAGVPQNRTRLYIVFTLGAEPQIELPSKEHVGFGCCVELDAGEWTKVKDQKRDFTRSRLLVARERHPDEDALLVNFDTKSKGRPLDRPIGTITTSAYGQWAVMKKARGGDVYRYLTIAEFKRAMDFPDDYVLPESKTAAGALLGNAVVPSAAEHVIRAGLEAVA